jgi:phage baseplate assembly protein W
MDRSTTMTEKAISLPFGFNESGGISFTTDIKKIWQDRVVMVVMTSLGERVMQPSFGSDAKLATFEPIENAQVAIQQAVAVAFSRWLPQLSLTAVESTFDETEEALNVEVTYNYGAALDDTVTIKTAILNRSGEVLLEVPNV